MIVLDRQTLAEKTSAPESSPQCIGDGDSLATYLGTLTSDDLVIVGTNYNYNADAQLNTSAMGGTDYTKTHGQPGSGSFPNGYIAIGAGGAESGSAYENYYTPSGFQVNPFATGMLVEDINGNYNFQSSGAIECTVSPNDPNNQGQSSVTLINSPFGFTYPKAVYTSPASQTNGYWVLTLQRDNLQTIPSCPFAANPDKKQTDYTGCGTFYPTGQGGDNQTDEAKRTTAFQALAQALTALNSQQLTFLVSVGLPAYSSSPWDVSGNNNSNNLGSGGWTDNGYLELGPALTNLGIPDKLTLSLGAPGSAFTYITSPGFGNRISGQSVLSTTTNQQQGQTGYVHGTLTRDLNGLYRPGHTQQETAGADNAELTIGLVASQQPVEWPELSGVLLPGAGSVAGQVAAYHYLSYQLVTRYYIKGAQGNYLDDIHYYFTGSNNTYIDYHTFDPVSIQFPGGCLVGCGGGKSQSQQPPQETGSKTILVNASSGSYTKTIPLVLNIQ